MSKLSFLKAYGINISRKSSLNDTPTFRQKSQNSTILNKSKNFEANIEEMKKVFDKYDRNKDGKVSKEEYKAMVRAISGDKAGFMTEEKANKSFQVADKDGDGFIEFVDFMELHNNKVKSKDIVSAFKVFDKDGDGKISGVELMEVLKRMGEFHSLESCKRMIKEVDIDGDGLINLAEFTTMMTQSLKNFT